MIRTLLLLTLFASTLSIHAADAPKRLLVVGITTGYRHSSIPLAEKTIQELGQKGGYTVDFLDQPPGKPEPPKNPKPPGPTATDADKAAYQTALAAYKDALKTYLNQDTTWEDNALKPALAALAPANLQKYDGVVFASTTGDLPLPDPQGFLDWIKAGHAFIGFHAASDTLHHWPGYIDMLGGEFMRHGPQISVDIHNMDPKNPATAALPAVWTLKQEEIYNFKNYDGTKVHELLALDKSPLNGTPGDFPLAWCKSYGKGRVFYCALGHREDLWDPTYKNRVNPPETAEQFRTVVLGGIQWALGLAGAN